MKIHRAALFLCLSGVCVLINNPVYGSSLKADNEQMELYLEKLQANIVEEEKAVESLRKKHEDILRNKQNLKKQEEGKKEEKESKESDSLETKGAAAEPKLKSLQSTQYSLRQKNQELLNSLEQSVASIHKKNETIEELRKRGLAQPKEKVLSRQLSHKDKHLKEDAPAKKQLDKLLKEKGSLESQLKALKEERSSRPAPDTVQARAEPRPDKKENKKPRKELTEGSFLKKSVDSKNSGKDETFCLEARRKDNPGILRGFVDRANKLDSWWREKVW